MVAGGVLRGERREKGTLKQPDDEDGGRGRTVARRLAPCVDEDLVVLLE